MRRKDREITDMKKQLEILDQCEIVRLGMCVDNKPYVVPLNFAYEVVDGKVYLYFHGASSGKKLDIISQNNQVCFEADCSYETIEAEVACDYSAKYQSIMGEGTIEKVVKEADKISALNIMMEQYGYQAMPMYNPQMVKMVTILKMTVESLTAKQKM